MTDRVAQTYALLASYADWEPPVRISVARGAIRGESPGRLEECRHCDATGHRGGTGLPCRFCKGRGSVPVDPQTGHAVADAETSVEQLVRRRRDRCWKCGGSGVASASSSKDPGVWRDVLELDERTGRYQWRQERRPPCPECAGTGHRDAIEMAHEPRPDNPLEGVQDPHGLEAAMLRRELQWQRGSYGALEARLRLLETENRAARMLLERHVIHPIDARLSFTVVARIDGAVRWIEPGMPHPIQVPAEALRTVGQDEHAKRVAWRGRQNGHARARRTRDDTIRALHQAGASAEQLMSRYQLGRSRLYEILAAAREVASGPAA